MQAQHQPCFAAASQRAGLFWPPLATCVCFGLFLFLLKLCSLDSSKFIYLFIKKKNCKNFGYREISVFLLNTLNRFFFCELLQPFLQFTQVFTMHCSTQQEVPRFNPSSPNCSMALTMEMPSPSYCQGTCNLLLTDTYPSTPKPELNKRFQPRNWLCRHLHQGSLGRGHVRHMSDPQSSADSLQHRLDQSVLSADPREKHK